MTANRYDITIEQGATFDELTLVYRDAASTPINLTGYEAWLQVREEIGGRVLASATSLNGRITLSNLGVITIAIPATETAGMNVPRAVYDLFLKPASGTPVKKLLYGDVTVNPSVSR